MPSADQPAILPSCRRENLWKGIVSLAPGSINLEQNQPQL
jgi:hypothetical protein